MPLQVIGAGYGRTGTLSLKTALEELGFPCYHMVEVFKNQQWREWTELNEGKVDPYIYDWEKVFGGYTATVDHPGCDFWDVLIQRFPEAKVILTVRDPEAWYQSMKNTVLSVQSPNRPWYVRTIVNKLPWNAEQWRFFDAMLRRVYSRVRTKDDQDKEHLIRSFKERIELVKKTVPADRLLIFEVKEGWDRLCQFLDVPVPNKPFPHVNDTKDMQTKMRAIRVYQDITFAALVGAVAAVAYNAVAFLFPQTPQHVRRFVFGFGGWFGSRFSSRPPQKYRTS